MTTPAGPCELETWLLFIPFTYLVMQRMPLKGTDLVGHNEEGHRCSGNVF